MPTNNINYSPLQSKWRFFDQPCQLTVTLSIDRQICKSTKNRPVISKNRHQVTHLGRSFKSLGAFLGVAAIINGVVTLQLTAVFPTASRNSPYSQQQFSLQLAGIPPTASRSFPYSQLALQLQLASTSTASQYFLQLQLASTFYSYCQLEITDSQHSLQLAAAVYSRQQEAVSCGSLEHSSDVNRGHSSIALCIYQQSRKGELELRNQEINNNDIIIINININKQVTLPQLLR